MKKQSLFTLLFALAVTFMFTACDSNNSDEFDPSNANIVEIAQETETLSTLVQAIQDAGLVETLSGDGPFTVFAPTDIAFDNLPDGTLESLTAEQLGDILTFHVVPSRIEASDLQPTQDVITVNGEEILVEVIDGTVFVNGSATVQTADVIATNGVIHIIDEVLLPQGLRPNNIVDQAVELGNFSTLVSALDNNNLVTTLKYKGDFTVFAPTDNAFNALPSGLLSSLTDEQLTEILTYHVLNGEVFSSNLAAEQAPETLTGEEIFVTSGQGTVTVNGNSTVVTADVDVSNGVIHAVDTVLLPDAYGTVVDAAAKRYNLSTLVSAVVSAQLDDDLSAAGPFTVFAPTNAAFDALPAIPTGQDLIDVLTYHVIPSQVLSGDLQASQTVTTLNGATVDITVSGDVVTINGTIEVSQADLQTNNGVIHVIDGVLLPPTN